MLKDETWAYDWDYDEHGSHIILKGEEGPIAEVFETEGTEEGLEVASYRAELMADAPKVLRLLDFCTDAAWKYFDFGSHKPQELKDALELIEKHKVFL